MLEEVIFGQITMPGEIVRILLAFAGVLVATYYDLFNKKNVPNEFLYGFLVIAFAANVIFYEESLFLFSIAVAAFLSAVGYVFYRLGQLGGADIFIMASIMLLLPIHPSFVGLEFNMPFIFSVIVFSGVLFALYVTVYFGWKLYENEAKGRFEYLLLLIPYLLFAYVYVNSFLFSAVYFAFITVLLFSTILFMVYRKPLMTLLSEELPVSQLEPEDVLALEIMNKDLVDRYKIPRLLTQAEIDRLKKEKAPDVWVYTRLPPFIPFILAGMLFALFLSRHLLLV